MISSCEFSYCKILNREFFRPNASKLSSRIMFASGLTPGFDFATTYLVSGTWLNSKVLECPFVECVVESCMFATAWLHNCMTPDNKTSTNSLSQPDLTVTSLLHICNLITHESATEKGPLGNVVFKQLPFAASMQRAYLDFPLYCVFSQAGGVTDLLANEAQCLTVMEKTHVGPTGGRIYVPRPQTQCHFISRPKPNHFRIFVMVSRNSGYSGWNVSGSCGVKEEQRQSQTSCKKSCKSEYRTHCDYLQLTWRHVSYLMQQSPTRLVKRGDKTKARELMQASWAWSWGSW